MTSSDGGQTWYFSGFGTPPAVRLHHRSPLAPGTSVTVNLELSIAYDPNNFGPGPAHGPERSSLSGTCASPTSCTSAPGLALINRRRSFTMTYGARFPVAWDTANVPTTPVPKGYVDLGKRSSDDPVAGGVGSVRHTATPDRDDHVSHRRCAGRYERHNVSFPFAESSLYCRPDCRDPHAYLSSTPVTRSTHRARTRRRSRWRRQRGTPFICQTTMRGPTPRSMRRWWLWPPCQSLAPSGSTVPVSALDLTLNIDPSRGPRPVSL